MGMLAKEVANKAAAAIIDAKAAPMRKKRRERLERRYSVVFGKEFATKCVENPDASELAIRRTQNQWQVALLVGSWLGVLAAFMYFDQYLLATLVSASSIGICRNAIGYYARRHFRALNS